MKDNVNNYFGTAPDHGSMKGPVLESLNSSMLVEIHGGKLQGRANSDDYWLSTLGSAGQVSTCTYSLLLVQRGPKSPG